MTRPFVFIALCAWCGRALDVIPVDGEWPDGSMHAAEQWAYVAAKRHEPDCEARPHVVRPEPDWPVDHAEGE